MISRKRKASDSEIATLCRQITLLLQAGIPLVNALNIVSSTSNNVLFKTTLGAIKHSIESGKSFTQALQKHDRYFGKLFRYLIHIGEESGNLDTLLDDIANYKEKIASFKQRIQKALFYPCIVLLTALSVTITTLLFIVPQFQRLFQDLGADLPLYTQMLINFSNAIKNHWIFIVVSTTTFIAGFYSLKKRNASWAYASDNMLIRLPFIKQIINGIIIARFSRTLGIALKAGIPITRALQITSSITSNLVYERALFTARQHINSGQQLHKALHRTTLFPHYVIQMITVGETTGSLDIVLIKIAEHFESRTDHSLDNLSDLLEPVIMIILGLLIGIVIFALYMPIFRLASVF